MSSLPIPADGRILFFKRDREAFGWMSNFFDAPITLDGEVWRSSEFYYQAQKSHDPIYREAIRQATSANHAKGLATDPRRSRKARKRSWFTDRVDAIRTDWNDVKLSILERAVRAKFTQNRELREQLLDTGEAEIIEDSTHDPYWGIGRDGQGENRMGRLLMQVRAELRAAEPSANRRMLLAALMYFAIVFGAGFLLGPVRVLLLVPRVGVRTAELMEAPFMLAAILAAARWIGRRYGRRLANWQRLAIGGIAVGMVLVADILVEIGLRDMSLTEVFTQRDPVSGTVYYGLLAICSCAPWFFTHRAARRR